MNYLNIYNKIINNSKSRSLECYTEKHHIIPKCLGGSNKKENIAVLTAREHFICHRLLVKIYKDNNKMLYALNRLINRYTKHSILKINSKTYSKLKKQHADLMSNRIVSKETKLKISKYRTGRKSSQETKDKLSKSLKGITKSKEWKDKISKAHLGKSKSPESIKKVSKYWSSILKDRPWKNSKANTEVWALANELYIKRQANISMNKISKELDIPYTSLVKIGKKLNKGWVPLKDKYWVEDFTY